MAKQYSNELKRQCVKDYETMTYKQVYAKHKHELRLSENGFRSILDKWKNKVNCDQELLDAANLGFNLPKVTKATVQVGVDGSVKNVWARMAPEENEFDINDFLKNLKPIDKIKTSKTKANDRLLVIALDDMHFGLATLEAYKKVLLQVLEVINSHKWECVFISFGADLLHTNDFNNLTSNGTYLGEFDYKQGWTDCLEFYRQIFVASLEKCNNVNCYYTQGNHSASASWDLLQVIKVLYPQVKYNDLYGFENLRKLFTWNGIALGLTHGHTISKKPKEIKEIFSEEFRLDFAKANTRHILVSHLHTEISREDVNGCVVERLPTGVVKGTYDKKHAFTMSKERFKVFEYDHENLKKVHYIDRV